MRRAYWPARVRSCRVDSTVRPRARRRSSTRSSTSCWRPTSSEVVGSSSRRTGASWASARASTARWRSPGQGAQVEAVEDALDHGQVRRRLDAEGPDVRSAAEQGVVDDPQRRWHERVLGDHGQQPGPGSGAQRGDILPAHSHGALEAGDPGERADQRRLAGAVGADHGHPLAGGHVEREVVEHGPPAQRHRQVPAGDRGGRHVGTSRRVRSTRAKNGAPTSAVTTPIGTSAGDRAVRARTSATVRKAPPSSRDTGRMTR
jgi:hypothetical protein